jgi:hypothetical protein
MENSFRRRGCRRIPWKGQETIDNIARRGGSTFPEKEGLRVPESELFHACTCYKPETGEIQQQTSCTCGAKCWRCHAAWKGLEHVEYVSCLFWGMKGKFQIKVPRVQCSQCQAYLEWDGHGWGIYRFSSETAVAYEICIQTLTLAVNGTPFSVAHQTFSTHYQLFRDEFSISPTTFTKVLWSFMESLQDNWAEQSSCPHCGTLETCRAIVVDGTAVAPRRELMKPEHVRSRPLLPELRKFKGSSSETRMFIPERRARTLFRQLTETTEASPMAYAVSLTIIVHLLKLHNIIALTLTHI